MSIDQVLEEWIESAIGIGSLSNGGVSYAREVLEKAFGASKASGILKRVQGQLADTAGLTRLASRRSAAAGQHAAQRTPADDRAGAGTSRSAADREHPEGNPVVERRRSGLSHGGHGEGAAGDADADREAHRLRCVVDDGRGHRVRWSEGRRGGDELHLRRRSRRSCWKVWRSATRNCAK